MMTNFLMIVLNQIRKTFRVAKRKRGAAAALFSLFRREYTEIHALEGISLPSRIGKVTCKLYLAYAAMPH